MMPKIKKSTAKSQNAVEQVGSLTPSNIAQKSQVIIEHFREHVAHLLNHEAKAMVVTSSRLEAVKYKQAFDSYVREKGYKRLTAMVAFSGEVVDEGESYTENSMNPGLQGRDMRKAFDTDDYQVMLVANKFQTGFDQPKLVAMYVDKNSRAWIVFRHYPVLIVRIRGKAAHLFLILLMILRIF